MMMAIVAVAALTVPASQVTVVDGDTVKVGKQLYRMLGIDAPELHGCPKRRRCVKGDPGASKLSLERMIHGRVTFVMGGQDRYGRRLAHLYVGGRNLACRQIKLGRAVYVRRWDDDLRLAKECPVARAQLF